ncbi:recombinase family protein [Echinicola rosea]|uniref:Recombinase RecB n=1 Tax=Echinicola rosea TaxID=1807691 RepID=A0ABQ1V980_9BACT|nr:recombinase family protein [Echinicola rosea]GGF42702.1 recombinase RecB [Echinicola rosea]
MKIADLYVRVSTDEQADKGYSQRNQEEVLKRYCLVNGIKVRQVIYEDHSAKTFDRPEWQRLLTDLKGRRIGKVDLILFTKWDRFSRNAGDAYFMINILRGLNIEPQAIEQPLDLEIPENKMMLAIYLAAPEVENDRRALNIFHGIRRATKEGRYLKKAPTGYINRSTETGKKYIAPKEPEASLVIESFEKVAEGTFKTEKIYTEMFKKGLSLTKSSFWRMLRNKHYIGKIFVPAYKGEESYFVEGQHEALISERLFKSVQDILDGRGRKNNVKIVSKEQLPLRGFLECPNCGRGLTGSPSKSKTGKYYYYYHCKSPCRCRFRADLVNEKLIEMLNQFSIKEERLKYFQKELIEILNSKLNDRGNETKSLLEKIENESNKLKKARQLLLNDKIDSDDFKEIKKEVSDSIDRLEFQLASVREKPKRNIKEMIKSCLRVISNLGDLYAKSGLEDKQRLLSSTFSEKLVFEKNNYRTPKVNKMISLIYLIDRGLSVKKNGTKPRNMDLCRQVELQGVEPWSR